MPNLEQYLLRTVPLVRNDKTEIKELNSLSIVRISISTYTQTRKKRVGSRMARISVAYSKSLSILEENDELFNILNWLLSTQLADSRLPANLPCKARMVKNSVQKKMILKLEIKAKKLSLNFG